jgi:hypothetical protein
VTEPEWLASDDLRLMLPFVATKWSERKGRLYMAAGLRAIWPLLYSEYSRKVIVFLEKEADCPVTEEAVHRMEYLAEIPTFGYEIEEGIPQGAKKWLIKQGAFTEADLASVSKTSRCPIFHRLVNAAHIAYHAHNFCAALLHEPPGPNTFSGHLLDHLTREQEWPGPWLVHEVVGNPFRPVTVDPSWLTSAIINMAQTIYDENQFEDLPILADALEDAGCTDLDVLNHLRGPGPHVRGCFAVDLCLGLN